LNDLLLKAAVSEIQRGLLEADLGGGIVKKRIALPGRGKRGSTRTLLATNREDRWFFMQITVAIREGSLVELVEVEHEA